MSRWPRCVVRAGESTKSGESSGGSEAHTSGCISMIWKRAKPTLSRLRTALGVVGSSSAKTSRRSVPDRTGRLSRATAKSQHWIKVCCRTLSVQSYLYRVRSTLPSTAMSGSGVRTSSKPPRSPLKPQNQCQRPTLPVKSVGAQNGFLGGQFGGLLLAGSETKISYSIRADYSSLDARKVILSFKRSGG